MTFDGRTVDVPPANTVYIGAVAITWGRANLTDATVTGARWASGALTAFPAGLFATPPTVTLTSTGDSPIGVTWGTRIVTAAGFTWRAEWDDGTAHSNPGAADFIAIGPRA